MTPSMQQPRQPQRRRRAMMLVLIAVLSLTLVLMTTCGTNDVLVAAERDLYAILGVKPDASDADIKRAYRKLSLKYHPDKNPGDEEAHKKYMDIQFAHEVLSDEGKRQIYDIDGEEGLKAEQQPRSGGGGIFDMFGFGGGGGGAGGKRRGPDYRMQLDVTLEDLYNGEQRAIRVSRNVLCRSCRGTGAKDGKTSQCPACQGKGHVLKLQQLAPGFNVQMQQTCDRCGGRGKTSAHACPVCGGKKVKMEEKELDMVIERGMKDGEELVFARASEQSPDTTPGDVIITLKQKPHSRFTRQGHDLHMSTAISLHDALLGFTTSIPHLDREPRRVRVERQGVTKPEFVQKIEGEGMPQHGVPSERGDLLIKYRVNWPKKLSEQQKEAIRALLS